MKILESLNEQQQKAATTVHGPVLILAGAGSGKTRTLTHRIAYMIEQKIARPDEILAVTFTNKAAKEMKERIRSLAPAGMAPEAVGTFHSLGARLLREQVGHHPRTRQFVIIDEKDGEKLAREAIQKAGFSPKEWTPRSVRHYISGMKNEFMSPQDAAAGAQDITGQTMSRIYLEYERLLAVHDAYDFDDLLVAPIKMLTLHPEVAERYRSRWRFLSVDEYQDTNILQEKLLQLLLHPEKNICVVGDDYQAIYSWRGAKVDHILHFEQSYPNCTTIYLTQNYRSTPHILTAANTVIANNEHQKHKELWTTNEQGSPVRLWELQSERAEAHFVRQRLETHVADGGRLSDCVVLYRTNAQSRVLEEEFLTHRVPYTIVGGFRFYERKEVKDALALLALALNPRATLAMRRLAESFLEGVGPKTIAKWEEELGESGTFLHVLSSVNRPQIQHFLQAIKGAGEQAWGSVAELLEHLLAKSGYRTMISHLPDSEDRLRNLEELVSVCSAYQDPAKFLEDVALLSDIDTMADVKDRVTCMTLHAAKGLEFPVVYLTGVEDGLLPHRNSFESQETLEEERRLLYVGMTRAKRELVMTHTQQRTLAGETAWRQLSRFIQELPPEVIVAEHATSVSSASAPTFTGLLLDSIDEEVPDGETIEVFSPNRLVKHPAFGSGVVLQQQGVNVTCIFEGFGVQTVPGHSLMEARV